MIRDEDLLPLIGVPYEVGGRGPDSFDCYGLVIHLMAKRGIKIPDYKSPKNLAVVSALMSRELRLWKECDPKAGAGVMFSMPQGSHCGVMIDRERFIHCWQHSGGVTIERISLWRKRVVGFYEYDNEGR